MGVKVSSVSLYRASFLMTLCMILIGCETVPPRSYTPTTAQAVPTLQGSYHQVRTGETLWRIARSYGLDPRALADANSLPNGHVTVGQRLFIPIPQESSHFLWPLRGSLKNSDPSRGVQITAPSGTLVRAARGGRVAVATKRLSGWGGTIVLDHLDGYLTVYSGIDRILVSPGTLLRQGIPIGSIGSRDLYFEIRYGETPKNTLALLPVS